MPRYMVLSKYTTEGLASVAEEGFANRDANAIRPGIEALGGKVEELYFCPAFSGFNFIVILTAPDSEVVNSMVLLGGMNQGLADETKLIELKTGDEADATLAAAQEATWRPPGS